MSRLAYIDAIAGVAGDMLLAALLDAGAAVGVVCSGLDRLGIEGLGVSAETVLRHSIGAKRISVSCPEDPGHRGLSEILEMIARAELPGRAAARAAAIFEALAQAEARVHRVPVQSVHFHEVGALDAIADVCGIALALEDLGIEEVQCSSLPISGGLTGSDHGCLPLPAPATIELLRGACVHGTALLDSELVTPTGAAAVAALAGRFGPPPAIALRSVGYGAGARELEDRPNVTRVLVGELLGATGTGRDVVSVIETNLDDFLAELCPDVMQRCFDAGALDVWVAPSVMKKGRPGFVFSAIARPEREAAVVEVILRETTALGVRTHLVARRELARSWKTVEVAGEPIEVKLGWLDGEVVNVAPEHDDCARAARSTGLPTATVWANALAAGCGSASG